MLNSKSIFFFFQFYRTIITYSRVYIYIYILMTPTSTATAGKNRSKRILGSVPRFYFQSFNGFRGSDRHVCKSAPD